MAHFRLRHALPIFEQLCRFSSLVGVFGHRQTGKTTFVSSHVKKYLTLDDEETLNESETSAKAFLKTHATERTAIDECQYSPKLFPALKEWARLHKKPGQFVLTGSVRFSSRKAIRESLTGRLISFELYPMVISELLKSDLPETLPKLLKMRSFQEDIQDILRRKPSQTEQAALLKYLKNGGLPGLCFVREERLQQEGISALINLILDRDLRLIVDTHLSLETLRRFLEMLARLAWQPYRFAAVRRETGISEETQKRLLFGFESIYLIRKIPFIGAQGECYLLEDQLEEEFLSKGVLDSEGKLLGALYRNLRAQFGYRLGASFSVDSYRTRGGARVPLVFSSQGQMIGVIPIEGNSVDLSHKRSADSFLRRYPESKVICVSSDPIQAEIIDSRLLKTSAASLLV